MKNHLLKTFNTIATQHRPLANLQSKATFLQAIDQCIHHALPDHLQHQCYLANIKGHTITVYAKNASSLTQLRFYNPEILAKVQQNYPSIKHIECSIKPTSETRPTSKPQSCQPVSSTTTETIQQMAKGIDEPELSEALQRLAKTLDNRR